MDFRGKGVCKFVESAFYISRKTFWGKKWIFFGFFPGFERKFFQLLAKTFGQVCRNCIERAQRNHLKETLLSEERVFCLFLAFERKAFGLSAEKYWHGCWNWLLKIHRTFIWTKTNFSFFLGFWAETIRTSSLKLGVTLLEMHGKFPEEQLAKKFGKKILFVFVYWDKNSRISGKKKLPRSSKLPCTSEEEHFEGKAVFRSFQDFERKIFQLSSRKLGRVCRNCIVLAQRSHLKKIFL